ncbi:MAG: hypothetical protein QJR00_00555 [Bacillota bacterium]|nr:hypothetical protein [Bacillota bacterium]
MQAWRWAISLPYPLPLSPGWWDGLPSGPFPPAVYGAVWGPRARLLAALRREARKAAQGYPGGWAAMAQRGAFREGRKRKAPPPLADALAGLWGTCRLKSAAPLEDGLPLAEEPLSPGEKGALEELVSQLVWAWHPQLPPPGWARKRLLLSAYQGTLPPLPRWDGDAATLPGHWRAWMELLEGPVALPGARGVLLDDGGVLFLWPEEEPALFVASLRRSGYRAGTVTPAPHGARLLLQER